MSFSPPATRAELARDLGVSHATAVVVGTIIGSGIFLVPAEMMQAVLKDARNAERAARRLVNLALHEGALDNVTVAVIRVA